MRKYLGWIALIVPPLTSLVASEIGWRFLTIGSPRRALIFDFQIAAWAAGTAMLAFVPFRSKVLKWTCLPLYAVVMPCVMLAIDLVIEGLNFGS